MMAPKVKISDPPEADVIYMTEAGKQSLQQELDHLLKHDRKQVLDDIRKSRNVGEVVENSGYEDAKREQQLIDGRIDEIQQILQIARVVRKRTVPTDHAGIGSIVELHDLKRRRKLHYQLVGPFEADPENAKVSYASPIGKALWGKKVGERVEVQAPSGLLRYRIENIKK